MNRLIQLQKESEYYYTHFDNMNNRLDFIFNHPRYENIKQIVSSSTFDTLENIMIPDSIHQGIGERGKEKGKIKFVNIENLKRDGTIDFTDIKYLDDVPSKRLFSDGIILLSRSRLVGICSIIPKNCDDITCGSYIFNFQVNKTKILPIFLAKFINSQLGQKQIEYLQTGSSGNNINISEVGRIKIINASITQQQNLLDNIMQIETSAKKKEYNAINELKKIDELLLQTLGISFNHEQIMSYARDFNLDNNRLDFVFNDPFYFEYDEIMKTSKFTFKELKSVVTFPNELTNPLERPNEEFQYVDIGSIDTDWGIMNPYFMMGDDATSSRMRKIIHTDQILVSTTRPTRRAIAIVPDKLDGEICSTGFASLACNEGVLNEYLFHILRSNLVTEQFYRYSSGSGYPEINKINDLPKIKVPIPENTEIQQDIIDKITIIVNNAKKLYNESVVQYNKVETEIENFINNITKE